MREIKFSYIYQEDYTGGMLDRKYTLDEMEKGNPARDKGDYFNGCSLVARRQYTGLKDSKDVEIYEGDIVRVAGLGVVEVIITPDYGVCYDLNKFICAHSYSDSAMEGDFPEIVGNIYENPELLGESDQ